MAVMQRSLFALGEPAIAEHSTWEHVELGAGCWVDVARGWLGGADALLDALVETVEWHHGRRWMYERVVDDPRLTARSPSAAASPHPTLADAHAALCARYGVAFGSLALNYYRDGRDSVAYHRDRELRELDDTRIAILTLGARRPFLLRPLTGVPRRSIDLAPASGDLLVMGGACQLHWEHAVPKVVRAGPRISASWRFAGARRDWMRVPIVRDQVSADTRTPSNRSVSYAPSEWVTSTRERASV
jgi:alkylated DNA repair dioxygenase AlkB